MDTKQLGHVEIKDEDKGEVTAVIATYGVTDSDGDVTEKGAHEDGLTVPISSYGHGSWSGALPVGKATLKVTDTQTIANGKFFLNTTAGRDTFETVKQLGGLGQWSYGYDVLDSELGEKDGDRVRILKRQEVHEVSPVLIGAGVETRTLATKNAQPDTGASKETTSMDVEYKAAIRPHSSAVTTRPWDEPAVLAGLKDDSSVSELRTVFAYAAPGSDPETKGSYLFPHHHGVDGPANVRALMTGIAVLNGARGDLGIPEEDRKAVYNHLAHHLKEADREPPELRPDQGQLKLHEEAIAALAGVDDYLESAERVAALRAEKGKHLSQVNLEALDWVGEDLRRVLTKHAALVRRLRDTPREAAAIEFARFANSQRLRSAHND